MKSNLLAIVVTTTFALILGITSCVHEPIDPIHLINDTTNTHVVDTTNTDTTITDTTIIDTNANDTVVLGIPCDPDSVYFNQQILPFLVSNCGMNGCHSTSSHKDGVTIASYATVKNTAGVSASNASGSKLYQVITTTNTNKLMPPPPAAKLSTEQIALIQKWINQGAKNLSCDDSTGQGGCDTSNVTFSAFVNPLIGQQCLGCHNASSANGGINLQGYTNVKTYVDNGKFLGSIKHTSGYSPMPQNQAKMDDCTIAKLEAWINNGALNN
ncbi:MAG: hypothetical protein NWR30_03495 [Salibacteraceae bacterium]|nr:hypothetical protein [Salibacteraceae bacterium]